MMLVAALKDGHHTWLVVLAVLMAAVSAFYYFRVLQAMFFRNPIVSAEGTVSGGIASESATTGFEIVLYVLAFLVILIGIFPGVVTDWLHY